MVLQMTKPLLIGCIKEKINPTWKEVNILLKKVTFKYEIGHLFIVDIEFNEKDHPQKAFV